MNYFRKYNHMFRRLGLAGKISAALVLGAAISNEARGQFGGTPPNLSSNNNITVGPSVFAPNQGIKFLTTGSSAVPESGYGSFPRNIGQLESGFFGGQAGGDKWIGIGGPAGSPAAPPKTFYGQRINWGQYALNSALVARTTSNPFTVPFASLNNNEVIKDAVISWTDDTAPLANVLDSPDDFAKFRVLFSPQNSGGGSQQEYLTIEGNGFTGIGESNPQVKLDITESNGDAIMDLKTAVTSNNTTIPGIYLTRRNNLINQRWEILGPIGTDPASNELRFVFNGLSQGSFNQNLNNLRIFGRGEVRARRDFTVANGLFVYSNDDRGRFTGAAGFDFNQFNSDATGLHLEYGNGESSGFHSDGDYAVIWSAGDQDRLVRFIEEDGMVERAYIDGAGNYMTSSDENLKDDFREIKGVMSATMQLKPYTYTYKIRQEEAEKGEKMPRRMGFKASEVEKYFPEAVETNEEGLKHVCYDCLVPILFAAYQELAEKLEMKESSNFEKSELEENRSINGTYMEQNRPNPFSDLTTIKYKLPDNKLNGSIWVTDMSGRMIVERDIQSNMGEVEVYSSELPGKGIYLYSLVVESRPLITKKMIVE